MRKEKSKQNYLGILNSRDISFKSNEIRTTDINILLNRVRINRKIEFKKKIILLSAVILFISLLSFFLLQ
jgi:hypothetical protein